MELVQIALLNNDTLKIHKRKNPSPYEWIVSSPTRLTRYYGDSSLICYGEKVRDALDKPHHPTVYLEQISVDSWYGCVMDSDGVVQEKIGSYPLLCDVLAYDLFMAHTLFTANDLPSPLEGRKEQALRLVPAIIKTAEDLDIYRLKKAKKNRAPTMFAIGLLLATVGGGAAFVTQSPPTPTTTTAQKHDPLTQWQSDYQASAQAGDAVLTAQHLLVMAHLLPTGSSATTLLLRDGKLTLPIYHEPTIDPSLWQQWLIDHPSVSAHYDPQSHDVTVDVLSQQRQPPQYNKESERHVMQQLHYLGFGIVLKEQNAPAEHVVVKHYQLSNTLALAALDIVSELLADPQLSIDELSLTLNDDVTVSVNMGITLQGTTL